MIYIFGHIDHCVAATADAMRTSATTKNAITSTATTVPLLYCIVLTYSRQGRISLGLMTMHITANSWTIKTNIWTIKTHIWTIKTNI